MYDFTNVAEFPHWSEKLIRQIQCNIVICIVILNSLTTIWSYEHDKVTMKLQPGHNTWAWVTNRLSNMVTNHRWLTEQCLVNIATHAIIIQCSLDYAGQHMFWDFPHSQLKWNLNWKGLPWKWWWNGLKPLFPCASGSNGSSPLSYFSRLSAKHTHPNISIHGTKWNFLTLFHIIET